MDQSVITTRKSFSSEKFQSLRAELQNAEMIASGKACVYATGSYGRQEASAHSDLDLFIIGETAPVNANHQENKRIFNRLDEICLKSDLIKAVRRLKIPEFDGDGKYLIHYTVYDLLDKLGTADDDYSNSFTARLLLLLESRPLIGSGIYEKSIKDVLGEYWEDYPSHETDFVPAYLANDILRLWRTFCINYEARTQRQPDRLNAKRKLKNYKLKHSRLLTCYSSLIYLLAIFRRDGTVSPADAVNMAMMTPLERLQSVTEMKIGEDARSKISDAIRSYEEFLEKTDRSEEELILVFLDPITSRDFRRGSEQLGEAIFSAMSQIGEGNRFHRLLIV